MRARKIALTTILSFGLLAGPGPGAVDVLPGHGGFALPGVGAEPAFAQERCSESVCVEVNLKVFRVTLCRSREYDC